jgi:hypothetical protein
MIMREGVSGLSLDGELGKYDLFRRAFFSSIVLSCFIEKKPQKAGGGWVRT